VTLHSRVEGGSQRYWAQRWRWPELGDGGGYDLFRGRGRPGDWACWVMIARLTCIDRFGR
jgi:hypothetical protein